VRGEWGAGCSGGPRGGFYRCRGGGERSAERKPVVVGYQEQTDYRRGGDGTAMIHGGNEEESMVCHFESSEGGVGGESMEEQSGGATGDGRRRHGSAT
jgi:hypothetical protein